VTKRYAAFIFFIAFLLSVVNLAKADDDAFRLTLPVEPPALVYMVIDDAHQCSGFIIKEGYILTAGHCVDHNPKEIRVKLWDGNFEIFTVFKSSYEEGNFQHQDWAILKGNTRGLRPLEPSLEPQPASPAFAFTGRHFHRLMTPGALIGIRKLHDDSEELLLVIDFKHGDSGGPVIGSDGKVIGITTGMGGSHQGFACALSNVLKFLP
jgi:hypothetical protein